MAVREVVVLVEGSTDRAVMESLIAKAANNIPISVDSTGSRDGKAAFPLKLQSLLATSGKLDKVGTFVIVRDSNGDAKQAFAEACDAFKSVGLPSPAAVGQLQTGNWTTQGTQFPVATAVWLVPGAERSGNLESLMLESLDGDGRLACVGDLLTCWAGRGFVMPNSKGNADRLRMQLWLSQFVGAKGYIHLGSSLSEKHVSPAPWDFDHAAFSSTIAFFRSL